MTALVLTNILLGVACLSLVAVVIGGVVYELRSRLRQRRNWIGDSSTDPRRTDEPYDRPEVTRLMDLRSELPDGWPPIDEPVSSTAGRTR